jgi:hypothetical protein
LLLVLRGAPTAIDDELDPVVRGISRGSPQGTKERWVNVGHTRNRVVKDRRAGGNGTVSLAEFATVLTAKATELGANDADG